MNLWKFGMIGSSDAHTSLSTTREDSFFGKTLACVDLLNDLL
ncbi:MAG: DUF3604 domain-containing protein [Hyphomicrobiaceae bacterium]